MGGLPGAQINKINSSGQTVPQSATGVAAIVAPCSGGGSAVTNLATSWVSPGLVQNTYTAGPLVELSAYELDDTAGAGLPIVAVKTTTTAVGTLGSPTVVKAIASTFSASVAKTAGLDVADDYNAVVNNSIASPIPNALAGNVAGVLVYFTSSGVLGTSGPQYVVSLDGGNSCSDVQSMGTATTIVPTEPNTGAPCGFTITVGTAAQTVTAGDYLWFVTVGPRMGTADLIAALQALYVSKLAFDLVLVHGETSESFTSIIEAWVLTMNARGVFPTVVCNTRFKNQTPGAVETEVAYASAVTAILAPIVGNDLCVGVDGGAYVSPLSGVTKALPTSSYVVAVCESNEVGTDPAEQDLGALGNCDIDNPQSTPAFHDEAVYNTLDTPGSNTCATTLRSWSGESGAFITNAYLMSSPGSDYVYIQNNRTMNACCTVAFAMVRKWCSKAVPRDPKTGFILEPVASAWERLVLKRIKRAVAGQVSGVSFKISRTDPLTGNGPQTITCYLDDDSLAYPKKIVVNAAFVSTLT